MKLKWHPLAIDDLTQIVDYCKATFGVKVAMRVKWEINSATKLLKAHPHLAPIEHSLEGCTSLQYRGLVVSKQTKAIYSIHADYIYIHLLWDVRQDEQRLSQTLYNRYFYPEEQQYLSNEPAAEYEAVLRK